MRKILKEVKKGKEGKKSNKERTDEEWEKSNGIRIAGKERNGKEGRTSQMKGMGRNEGIIWEKGNEIRKRRMKQKRSKER